LDDPTLTALFTVETIEARTKKLKVIGYAAINIFVDLNTGKQPETTETTNYVLNEGSFQIPIRMAPLPELKTFHANSLDQVPAVLGASLLVRIGSIPVDNTGKPLRRINYPQMEWENLGLYSPPPSYSSGAYDSTRCVKFSRHLFKEMMKRKKITAREAFNQLYGTNYKDDEKMKKAVVEKMKKPNFSEDVPLDYTYMQPYTSMGIKVTNKLRKFIS
jgi:hypothetical protein